MRIVLAEPPAYTLVSEHPPAPGPALGQAREGAERARGALTWDAAAEAHLELCREAGL